MIGRLSAGAAAVAVAAITAIAWASWTTPASAGSKGGAAAATVNQGATPSVSVTAIGREVAVSWGAATLSNGAPVGGYLVERYPSGGGSATMNAVGTCSGTVSATSCVEDDVPTGTWRYTVTPVLGGWHGAESLTSGVVTLAAAALTVNGSPFGNAAFTPLTATATGSISGFSGTGTGGHGEGVSYQLDSSTTLVGLPVFVGTNGGAAITALAIPKSAGDGAHTVYALGDAAYSPSQASAGIVIDTTAPSVSAQLSPSPGAGGWNNSSPVSVALGADDGTGSGVSLIKYTTDGSDPTSSGTAQVYGGSPFSISAEGTTTVKFYVTDLAGNASAVQSQAVKIDTAAPTGGALTVNGTAASGAGTSSYSSSGSFTIGAISDYTDAGSGLASSTLTRQAATLSSSNGIAAGSCGSFGAASTISSRLTPIVQSLSGPSCYLYTLTGTDNVGNSVSISTTVKVDTSAPSSPSVSLASASGNTYLSGTTVYINAQAGKSGSFQASATSSDGDSGLLKLNFPALSGFSSGGGDVGASPYQTTYSWSGAVSASGSQTVTAYDNAGLTSTASFTVTPDTAAPTGGALTVNGTAASGAGTSSYNSSGSFTIGSISDYTDAGSGLASSTLTRQAATLSSANGIAAGSCGSFGAASTISSRLTPIAQSLSGPSCYLYTLTGTDNVGNSVSISTTVKVDTSAPSSPSVALASASGNTYLSGTTVYINAQAGKSGSFQASATSSDGDSGLLKLNFPALSGFSSGGGDVGASPYQTSYSWSGAVSASGSQTVTAYDNAGLTSTAGFTVTPDTAAPTGGALTVDGTAASGAGTTSSTSNPNFAIGTRTDYSDSGSGLASSTLTVESETLTNNATCGAAGSGGPYTSATTISGTTNPAITVGYCYLYTLTGTDNVGNAVSISTTVKVPFAGIDWTSITTSNNRTVTCNYATITAVTCTVSGVGSGGTLTANVRLIDANHNTVSNTTGSTITVSQTTTGQGTGAPASTTIAQSASASAGAFTLTLNNGGSKTATITASITVNGVTYTVNCQVST